MGPEYTAKLIEKRKIPTASQKKKISINLPYLGNEFKSKKNHKGKETIQKIKKREAAKRSRGRESQKKKPRRHKKKKKPFFVFARSKENHAG